MLGGDEAFAVGTGGLGAEGDPNAIDSLRDLCTTFAPEGPFLEGGGGKGSDDFLAGLSPPLWLGGGSTGAQEEDATPGAPHGDPWDPNDLAFASSVMNPGAEGAPFGPPLPWEEGRADPVEGVVDTLALLGDLDALLQKEGRGDIGVVDKTSPGKDPEGGITAGPDSTDGPPPPPPSDDEPAGGTTPENGKARQGEGRRGGKKKKARGSTTRGNCAAQKQAAPRPRNNLTVPRDSPRAFPKNNLTVPRDSPRAFPKNRRTYFNGPISTIDSVKKRQDKAEEAVTRHAKWLRLYAEEATRRAREFGDAAPGLIAAERSKIAAVDIRTVDGSWLVPGIPAEE